MGCKCGNCKGKVKRGFKVVKDECRKHPEVEIKWILGWYRDKKSQSESWCQQLDDLYDKLIDALNKNN